MESHFSGNGTVFVGVRLDEATVRALDRFAVEHQRSGSRKLGRSNVVRGAVAHFLRSQAAAPDNSVVRQRSRPQ